MKMVCIGNKAFNTMLKTHVFNTKDDTLYFDNHRDKGLWQFLNSINNLDRVSFFISELTEDKGGSENLRIDGFTTALPFLFYFLSEKKLLDSAKFHLFSFLTDFSIPTGLRKSEESNIILHSLPINNKRFIEEISLNAYNGGVTVEIGKDFKEMKSIYNHEINYLSFTRTNFPMKAKEESKKIKVVFPILDDELDQRKQIKNELSKFKNDVFDADFPVFSNGEELLQFLLGVEESNDNDYLYVQAILLDWYLFEENNTDEVVTLIRNIRKLRPNVIIYVLTKSDEYHGIINSLQELERIEYRKKGEDYEGLWEAMIRDLHQRTETPFWLAYKKYALNANFSWHTPGHSGGKSFKNSSFLNGFYSFFGSNVFKADLSVSVDELGSLFSGSGKVEEAQAYASKVFGTKKTYFVTNGSSTSNKILLQFLLKSGDTVIADRNCHKSVHYGLIMGDYKTFYLNSEYSNKTGFFAPPSKKSIIEAVKQNSDTKLLILTGCTYDGIMMNLNDVISEVKDINPNVKIMIDEAWFCYASFHHSYDKYSAIKSGADYITHSAHKVLSAFSQASYIHINDPDFDDNAEQFFMEAYCMNTSTSPQYNLIASLEVAALQMEMEGFAIIEKIRKEALEFRKEFNRVSKKVKISFGDGLLKNFGSIQYDNCDTDPLKIIIDFSNSGLSMDYILKEFREANIQVEKSTRQGYVLLLYTIGSAVSKTGALYGLLRKLDNKSQKSSKPGTPTFDIESSILEIGYPEEGFHHFFFNDSKEYLSLDEINQKIEEGKNVFNCHLIVPYPPGIPILIPGSKIDAAKCKYLTRISYAGGEIHGIRNNKLAVIVG